MIVRLSNQEFIFFMVILGWNVSILSNSYRLNSSWRRYLKKKFIYRKQTLWMVESSKGKKRSTWVCIVEWAITMNGFISQNPKKPKKYFWDFSTLGKQRKKHLFITSHLPQSKKLMYALLTTLYFWVLGHLFHLGSKECTAVHITGISEKLNGGCFLEAGVCNGRCCYAPGIPSAFL